MKPKRVNRKIRQYPEGQTVYVDPRRANPLSLYLKTHGVTQTEMAQKMHTSQVAISRWIAGLCEPSTYRILQMFYLTNGAIKMSDFLTRKEKLALAEITGIKPEELV